MALLERASNQELQNFLLRERDRLEEKLRDINRTIAMGERILREEQAKQGPHAFYFYLEGELADLPTLEVIAGVDFAGITCEGCGEARGHENHKEALIAHMGEENYNARYGG